MARLCRSLFVVWPGSRAGLLQSDIFAGIPENPGGILKEYHPRGHYMRLEMASLVAVFCFGAALAEAKSSAAETAQKNKTTTAAKECSPKDKKSGKCVSRSGSRAPASVSVAAEASVRRGAVDKATAGNPEDSGDK